MTDLFEIYNYFKSTWSLTKIFFQFKIKKLVVMCIKLKYKGSLITVGSSDAHRDNESIIHLSPSKYF